MSSARERSLKTVAAAAAAAAAHVTAPVRRRVTLIEIDPGDWPYPNPETGGDRTIAATLSATVVRVAGTTAFVRHDPRTSRWSPWTFPVDRITGRPPPSSDWAWRVHPRDLPL